MKTVPIHAAKTNLSRLIERSEADVDEARERLARLGGSLALGALYETGAIRFAALPLAHALDGHPHAVVHVLDAYHRETRVVPRLPTAWRADSHRSSPALQPSKIQSSIFFTS